MNDNEHDRLTRRIRDLESRCAALMVDADRRAEAATKRAEDCVEHGKEIQYLRHLASWCWHDGQDADEARRAIVIAMQQFGKQLDDISKPIPPDQLRDWLKRAMAAYDRKSKLPPSYPTLADCQRAGGCNHDDVSPKLRAEIEHSRHQNPNGSTPSPAEGTAAAGRPHHLPP